MAGLNFFHQVVELEKKYNINNCVINNAIQTNGYVIDSQWTLFFAKNNFLVGISLDGPKDIHDENRLDASGKGTYSKVMYTIQLFKQYKVEYNVLTVVTASTCRNINKVYSFFKRNEFIYQQYIPCLDSIGEVRGGHSWSLTPELFEKYLKALFDCWYLDAIKGNAPYIRYFENLLFMMNGQPSAACGMNGVCSKQYVVEADGSVYPCDFYFLDKWNIGNLVTDDFSVIEEKRRMLEFVEALKKPHAECLSCKWVFLCRGGCRRDWDYFKADLGKNYFCSAYYSFFEYVSSFIIYPIKWTVKKCRSHFLSTH